MFGKSVENAVLVKSYHMWETAKWMMIENFFFLCSKLKCGSLKKVDFVSFIWCIEVLFMNPISSNGT